MITAIITLTCLCLYKNVFSWGLFNFFTDTKFSQEGLEKAIEFNPDKDILYLPEIGDKDIFKAMKDLSICRNPEVRSFIYQYLTRGREYTIKSIERSHYYYDIIDEIFSKNPDIPREIALLPLLESGFSPIAVSRSKAVGLWQFVSNTAKPLGLKYNRYVDERRDIEKSTSAAIRHLRNMYKIFNSWELALAAYNGGGGHVKRALQASGEKDLWGLIKKGALRKETEEYVPRFIALSLIYKHPRLFGIKDEIKTVEIPETANLVLPFPIQLNSIPQLCGTPMKTIKKFNPELKLNITPPYQKDYSLRLPVNAKKELIKKKKKLMKYRFTTIKRYTLKKGDCISLIARRYKKKLLILSDLTA